MKHALFAAVSLLIAPLLVQAAKPTGNSDRSFNILILYADDLGFGDLGCYHSDSKIPTPNLDQLAAEGMRFTDGHSSSGICTPSRYALLTGRHHWRDFHGIVNALGSSVFRPERLTLPEMLKQKGYHTSAIGKWHLGWDWEALKKPGAKPIGTGRRAAWGPDSFDWSKRIPDGPLAHGFDHYFGDTVINFPPYCWIEDDKVVRAPDTLMDSSKWKPIKEGNWECRPGPMISDWDPYQNIPTTTKRGVDYIHAQADQQQPFFLYFAFPSPHAPIIPNDKFDGKSKAGPYGDFVVETDDACGRLLRALKESGQDKNTVIVFTADNGPEKYAYARDEKFDHWSAHPLRGLKRDIYEGGHHVPYLIKWPGLTKPGGVSDALVSQIDLMATFASALDFDLPNDAAEDSHDLLPLLKGTARQIRKSHVHNTRADQYAIRDGDWLLINHKDGYVSGRNQAWEKKHGYTGDDKLPVELYNMKQDIGQRKNLAAKEKAKVAQLQALLAKIRQQGHSAPRLSQSSDAAANNPDAGFQPDQSSLPTTAPEGAIILFDGQGINQFSGKSGEASDWRIEDACLVSTAKNGNSNHIVSNWHFRDAEIHVEFNVSKKAQGNSGIYIHGNYELQIMDTHHRQDQDLSHHDQGSIYGFHQPLVNAAKPAGQWQVYDILYRAPRRDAQGKITKEGSITAWLNGQKVQDYARFGEPRSKYHPYRYRTTDYLKRMWQVQTKTMTGPFFLQDHSSPCRFRNVWIRPLDDQAKIYAAE